MAEQSPTPSTDQSSGRRSLAFFEVGIVEILSIIFILILFFGILNYFNILSISQMFPQLSWLPHREIQKQNMTINSQNLKPSTPSKPSYACPLSSDLCKTGVQIFSDKTVPPIHGMGFENLASGTPVLAIIPGKYNSGVAVDTKGDKHTVLSIINDEWGIEADFQFKGTPYTPAGVGNGEVRQGDTIGWLSSDRLEKVIEEKRVIIDREYSLIVSIQSLKSKEFLKLLPSSDGKKLDIIK